MAYTILLHTFAVFVRSLLMCIRSLRTYIRNLRMHIGKLLTENSWLWKQLPPRLRLSVQKNIRENPSPFTF